MKLDRNIVGGHGNKYALIKNRRLEELRDQNGDFPQPITDALLALVNAGVLDWGCTPDTEFFVMRLKDKYAGSTLGRYAALASADDPEYAKDIAELSLRAGGNHPNCKMPD